MAKDKKAQKLSLKLRAVFFDLIAIFAFIVGSMSLPGFRKQLGLPLMVFLAISFFLLGLLLIFLTLKERIKGKQKKFLLLTGICASGFLLGVFLHNFLYALAIITKDIPLLPYLMEVLHIFFFSRCRR